MLSQCCPPSAAPVFSRLWGKVEKTHISAQIGISPDRDTWIIMVKAKEFGWWLKKRTRAGSCPVLSFVSEFLKFLKLKITFVLITHMENIIVPAFSVSPLSSVISASVNEERPASEKSPRPRFITEKSLWGKVAPWHAWFQVRPLPTYGDWDPPLQLPHCGFVVYGDCRLWPQRIRGLLILNSLGGGWDEGELDEGNQKAPASSYMINKY